MVADRFSAVHQAVVALLPENSWEGLLDPADSVEKVERQFEEFNRLFLYAHLQERYRNRSWVVLDGDDSGVKVVEKLRARYQATWEPDRFDNWSLADFERFYPAEFSTRVDEVLALEGQAKRDAKKELLDEVVEWLEEDVERGRLALAASAGEVITRLQAIESALFPVNTTRA